MNINWEYIEYPGYYVVPRIIWLLYIFPYLSSEELLEIGTLSIAWKSMVLSIVDFREDPVLAIEERPHIIECFHKTLLSSLDLTSWYRPLEYTLLDEVVISKNKLLVGIRSWKHISDLTLFWIINALSIACREDPNYLPPTFQSGDIVESSLENQEIMGYARSVDRYLYPKNGSSLRMDILRGSIYGKPNRIAYWNHRLLPLRRRLEEVYNR